MNDPKSKNKSIIINKFGDSLNPDEIPSNPLPVKPEPAPEPKPEPAPESPAAAPKRLY